MNNTSDVGLLETTPMTNIFDVTRPCSAVSTLVCDPLLIAARYFTLYGTYIAYAVGLPGNVLTCVVLTRMKPFNSSIIWLIVLTFTDLVNLGLRFIFGIVLVSVSSNQEIWRDWSCKMFYIITETCNFTSNFYVLGLTCERFIAVQFPLKMSQWCTVRRSVTAVAVCLIVCLSQSMYVIEVYRINSNNVCIMREKYKGTWGLFYESYFQPTVLSLLPIILLIVLNFMIFRRLHKVSKFQKQMTETINKNKVKQQKQINRMLMASSICLCICLMPDILYQYINVLMDRSNQGIRSRIILMNVFGVLKIYNCAANFFLYIIAANKFRTELLRLISCKHYGGASSTDKSTTPPNKNINYI